MMQIAAPGEPGNIKALPTRNFLSQNRERQLIARWQDHRHEEARNELVVSFAPLLVREARRFMRKKRITQDGFLHDLVAVGLAGLDTDRDRKSGVTNPRGFLYAIEKFDLSKPYRLSTYALHWIRCAHLEWHRLECHRGVSGAPRAAQFLVTDSLDRVISVEEDGKAWTLGDTICDEHDFTADAESESAALHECIRTKLTDRECVIINARHLNLGRQTTFVQLGRELGISGERARQIAIVALQKLHKARALVRSGPSLWPATRRWNSLGLDKPIRRYEIPDEILKLAAREPSKPDWWRYRRCPKPADKLWNNERTYACRRYGPDELAEFVTSRPDLLWPKSKQTRQDHAWWLGHKTNCIRWSIEKPSSHYRFRDDGPAPYARWLNTKTSNVIAFPHRRILSVARLRRVA